MGNLAKCWIFFFWKEHLPIFSGKRVTWMKSKHQSILPIFYALLLQKEKLMLWKEMMMTWARHGFKNRTRHQTIFFLNFLFNPGFWPVFGVLTGPDWLPVPDWTGRTGRSGPVFKTVELDQFHHERWLWTTQVRDKNGLHPMPNNWLYILLYFCV